MKLKAYLALVQKKPYVWAKENDLNISRVYAWLNGAVPDLDYILRVKKITSGAVGPEDWDKNAA